MDDPLNRRIGKKKNGQLQYGLIYQDSLRPIADTDENGQLKSIYLYADKGNVPTAMLRADKSYLIISDHLGSVRQVIDTQTGEIAQQLDYDAWGRVIEDSRPGFQPFGFAGGLHDPDTRLTRFGARDYDAETGRWTAKDPILFNGGDTNLYGYVLQDPVNLIDPSGLRNWIAHSMIEQALREACGDSRKAHDLLMEKRAAIKWEALSVYGHNLRIAENYMTSYDGIMHPITGDNTPRVLAYVWAGVAFPPVWQAIRVIQYNILDSELDSPPSLEVLGAGYKGANDAIMNYYKRRNPYECTCKK